MPVKLKLINDWFHISGMNTHRVHIPRHSTHVHATDPVAAQLYLQKAQNATQWPLPEEKPAPVKERLSLEAGRDKYLKSLVNVPEKSNTRKTYHQHITNGTIKPLAAMEPPITMMDEVTHEILNTLLVGWQRRYKTGTIRNYREKSSQLFTWAANFEYIKKNPWKLVVAQAPQKKTKAQIRKGEGNNQGSATMPLDREGNRNWLKILAAVPEFIAQRNARNPVLKRADVWLALLRVMYELGLRRSDAVNFRPDWIETTESGGSYTAPQWKTGDFVTCYLEHDLMQTLRGLPLLPWRGSITEYEEAAEKRFVPGAALYPFYDGTCETFETYGVTNVNVPLRELGKELGFDTKENSLHPHRFRHSFAVNILNMGMQLQDLQIMLGHRRLETTEKHYRPFVLSVKKAIEKRLIAARQAQLFEEAMHAPRSEKFHYTRVQ